MCLETWPFIDGLVGRIQTIVLWSLLKSVCSEYVEVMPDYSPLGSLGRELNSGYHQLRCYGPRPFGLYNAVQFKDWDSLFPAVELHVLPGSLDLLRFLQTDIYL